MEPESNEMHPTSKPTTKADDLLIKICEATEMAKQLPKCREMSLVLTKLEEAQLWLGTAPVF